MSEKPVDKELAAIQMYQTQLREIYGRQDLNVLAIILLPNEDGIELMTHATFTSPSVHAVVALLHNHIHIMEELPAAPNAH